MQGNIWKKIYKKYARHPRIEKNKILDNLLKNYNFRLEVCSEIFENKIIFKFLQKSPQGTQELKKLKF